MAGGYDIITHSQTTNATPFDFPTDPAKLRAFHKWLQDQVDKGILTVDEAGKPWLSTYVMSAYKKGMLRAYTDSHAKELGKPAGFYEGTQQQFLESSFMQPEAMSKIEFLSIRSFEELKGITAAMSQQMNRVLATGMVQGQGPGAIARMLSKTISGISSTRAKMIARTEVIAAHAEGQLDGFDALGIKGVGLNVEFDLLTAGDDIVCSACQDMADEGPYTIEEARGIIPIHPNDRCCWGPAVDVPTKNSEVVTNDGPPDEPRDEKGRWAAGGASGKQSKSLPWHEPPPPTGLSGRKAGGFSATGKTNTMIGDAGEALLVKKLGMISLLPPGQRQNPLDVKYDHTNEAYEVKTVTT
jgi:hypothetical protein